MQKLAFKIEDFQIPQAKKRTSERAELIQDLYNMYTCEQETLNRKIANWKRYIQWCRDNKVADSKESQKKFKKSKSFIKVHPIKSFCFFLSHIPTKDLYYVYSVGRDIIHRKEKFSPWLFSSIKK